MPAIDGLLEGRVEQRSTHAAAPCLLLNDDIEEAERRIGSSGVASVGPHEMYHPQGDRDDQARMADR